MKLFKPQVQIARRTIVGAPNEYFLHAVTFCNKSNYRAAGFQLDTHLVEDEGILTVSLNIAQDISIPEFNYLTPVVHTIDLGPLAFPDDDGIITVESVMRTGTRSADTAEEEKKNKSTVSATEADEAGRPVP